MNNVNLGGSDEQFKEEMGNGGPTAEIGRFKEYGNYTHRVLAGPKRMDSCWYPSWREDSDTGAIKSSWNRLILPKRSNGKTITDKIATLDRKIQKEEGIDSQYINSPFDRQTRYIYIVLSRDETQDPKTPWIGFWEYPTSVSKKVRKLNKKESSKNKGMLSYGPYWTYDIDIEKENTDSSSDKRFSTQYNTDVVAETIQYAGQIPVEVVTDSSFQYDEIQKIQKNVFTPEELKAIQSFMKENDLDSYVNPLSNEEIVNNLTNKSPIRWDEEQFKFKDKLLEAANNYKDRLVNSVANTNEQLAEQAESEKQVKPESNEEDSFEEISDEEMQEEESFLDEDDEEISEDW